MTKRGLSNDEESNEAICPAKRKIAFQKPGWNPERQTGSPASLQSEK